MASKAKTYEQLRKEWYAKLKKSGFEDIEDLEGRLITYTNNMYKPPTHDARLYSILSKDSLLDLTIMTRESGKEYYRLAEHFFNDYKFTSKKHKDIWELHSNGYSERDIVLKLIKKYPGIKRGSVQNTIGNLRKIMLGGL